MKKKRMIDKIDRIKDNAVMFGMEVTEEEKYGSIKLLIEDDESGKVMEYIPANGSYVVYDEKGSQMTSNNSKRCKKEKWFTRFEKVVGVK